MRFKILMLVLMLSTLPAQAKEAQKFDQPVRLERVVDGDTIVASGKKIRLWGINAPEKGQPLFNVATMYLKAILAEGGLACKFIEYDRYQRSVMHCSVSGADVGSMMVQMGMARDYTRYSGGFYQVEQAEARKFARGIWKATNQPKTK